MEGNGQRLMEILSRRLLGGTENNAKTTIEIAGISVKIRTEYLLNTSLENYLYTILLDTWVFLVILIINSENSLYRIKLLLSCTL
jgi:hypothetical protein